MSLSSTELIELVNGSPRAVAVHDRQAWLDLFAEGGIVQDPVGTAPGRKGAALGGGRKGDQLSAFYDTFIGPSEISFTIVQDIVLGLEVVRDVIIHIQLSSGLRVEVPAYIRYRATRQGEATYVESLEAHWELLNLSGQVLSQGLKGLSTLTGMTWRMLKNQGLYGLVGYVKGMTRGIFGRGHRAISNFASAINTRDEKGFLGLFDPAARIEFPAGKSMAPADFLRGPGEELRLEVSSPVSSGWWSSCVFEARREAAVHHGVAFFSFKPGTKKIESVQFYWNG